jgi:glucose-1-phosphate adenylyltransferase
MSDCTAREAIISEGSDLDRCTVTQSVIGIRTIIRQGANITRSVLLGADYYDIEDRREARDDQPRLGIGCDAHLDGVIVDKNARIGDGVRLTNEKQIQHGDGPGYYIRDGIVVVPKDATVPAGTIA